MDTGIERLPPHAIETEQSVLAACMIDSRAVARAAVILQGDPDAIWYHRPHALVWQAVYDLWDEGEPTDSVTIADRLRVAGTLEAAGGWEYVHGLEQGAFTAANVAHHARTVLGKARARRLIEIGAQLCKAGYADGDLPAVVTLAVDDLWSLTAERTADAWVSGDSAVSEAMDAYRKAKESGGALSGVPTGLLDLDRLTGGWQPGDLVLIGARPGMGKTSLAVTSALAAAKAGHAVGLVSLEMSRRQVGQRILAQAAGISLTVIRTGQGSEIAEAGLQDVVEKTKGAPIWIDDSPGLSVSDLRARVRHLVHRREAKLVIVDYLQLLDPDERSESSERETREISKALKRLAREAQVPVIALCQLSRQSEGRADKRPQLSDLRYSGSLEQDADLVLLLHRPEAYGILEDAEGKSTEGRAEVILAKHRQGATAVVSAYWDAPTATLRASAPAWR